MISETQAEMLAVPRFSLEAESEVVGGLLIAPETFSVVQEVLGAADFHSEPNRVVYRTVARMVEEGAPVAHDTLVTTLQTAGELEAAGGVKHLAELFDYVPATTAEKVAHHARAVRALSLQRQLAAVAADLQRDPGNATLHAALAVLAEQMEEAKHGTTGPQALRSLAELLADPETLSPLVPVVPRLAWAGRVTLLAAREKLGKSTLAGAAAAAKSRGWSFFGEPTTAGNVLLISLEEHAGDTAVRFVDFGADPERIFVLDRVVRPLEDLAAAATAVQPELIVVDTLAALTDGLVQDPTNDPAWTGIMGRITRLARDTNAAVLLLAHSRKSDGRYRDSTRIGANVDFILEMLPDDDLTVRRIEGRGRRALEDYAVRLRDGRYELAGGGEVSLDARVLIHIEQHPGCSMRSLRGAVTGKTEAISTAVDTLIRRGAVRDEGDGGARKLFAGPNPQGTAGNRPGTAREPVREPLGAKVVPQGPLPEGEALGTAPGTGGEDSNNDSGEVLRLEIDEETASPTHLRPTRGRHLEMHPAGLLMESEAE